MYYSDEIIEEVRSSNDIVDVIGSYVSLKKKGNTYSACCPFHHEKTPSFHVNRDKQIYHCFGCGLGGNVYTFVMEYENYSFPEAVKFLADRGGVALPEMELSAEQKKKENYKLMLKDMNKAAAAYFHYLLMKTDRGAKAKEYLLGRGLSEDTIKNFALGYSDVYENDLYKYLKGKGYTDAQLKDSGLVEISEGKGATDKFWNRVMVPILDINNKVIAFGGRVMGDGKPKYINTKETAVFDKSRNLFAMNIAKKSRRRGIIICEGYMDVISMHQAGFDNAVASLGTAFTIGQATIIKRYTDDVYLAYDSDGAGTNATLKAIGILREADVVARVIDMKPYKDPDEFIQNLGSEEFENRINKAITGIEFEVSAVAASFNLKDPEEKIRFAKEVARRLATIEDSVARHSYMDVLCDRYNLDKDGFKDMIRKYGTVRIDSPRERIEPQATSRVSKDKSEISKTQSLLLTWMVNDTGLFKKLSGVISEDDFSDEECKIVAKALFDQYRDTGDVNPAALINMSDDVDKQRLIAGMIQTDLKFEPSVDERESAINEVVRKIKLDKIDRELSGCGGDMQKFQQLIMDKANLSKLHISL